MDSSGLGEEFKSLAKSLSAYLSARAELVTLEGREAGETFKKRALGLVMMGVSFLLAYLLVLVAGIYFLGGYLQGQHEGLFANWAGAALIIGGFHALLGMIFWRVSRPRKSAPLFELTRSEWKKDQQWLSKKTESEK